MKERIFFFLIFLPNLFLTNQIQVPKRHLAENYQTREIYITSFFDVLQNFDFFILNIEQKTQRMCDSQTSDENRKQIVYLLSPDFNAPHVSDLVKIFNQNSIPIQFQKDQDSLGVPLDRRYFVVVDNMKGKIVLGSWFSSLLLFIVGYPIIGNNKKNHYCSKPLEVLDKYREFCSLPQFTRKIFLSSAISEKSSLKTSRSLNANAVSETAGSKIEAKVLLNGQPIKKINQHSKLFLYLSQKNVKYNKWILKIAANNQKKFEIIDDIDNLALALSVCRTQDNFLFVNVDEYEAVSNRNFKGLRILVYAEQDINFSKKQNIIGICRSRTEIIQSIRNIGFQVVSLKDIDKSIVKYDNPFAKQLKPRSNRRINWEKQADSEQNLQIPLKLKNKASAPNLQYDVNNNDRTSTHPVIKISAFDESSQETLKTESVARNENNLPAQIGKQAKRMSIQSSVSKNQKNSNTHQQAKQLIKNIEYDIPLPMKKQILQEVPQTPPPKPIKKVRRVKSSRRQLQKQSVKSEYSCSKEKDSSISSSLSKQSKVLRYKSVAPQVYNQKQSFKDQGLLSTIEQTFPELHLANTDSWTESLSQQKWKNNPILKCRNKNQTASKSMTSPEGKENIELIYPCQKSNIEDAHINLRCSIINDRFSFKNSINGVSTKFMQEYEEKMSKKKTHYDKVLLLWKDFNFQIQNNRNFVLQWVEKNQIINMSFYSPTELTRMIEAEPIKKIVIFIDQLQIQQFLMTIQGYLYTRKIISIYIFQKNEKCQAQFVKTVKQLLKFKPFSNFKQVVKPVIFNQYFDEGLQAAKQVITIFLNE